VRAVDNISFEIGKGEIVGYIGPNGAGKSTTVKILTGILIPTAGEVLVNGLIPHKQRYQNAKQIGVVFGQRTQLWWDIAVIEAFKLLRKIYEIPKVDFDARMDRFEQLLELKDLLHVPVRKLSLGQRMRCDLAASLLHNPPLVFLDEPTIGLDIGVKVRVREFIREINRNARTTVILTTHDLNDIEELCERVMIIDSGKIVYDGRLQALKERLGRTRRVAFEFSEPVSVGRLQRVLEGRGQDMGRGDIRIRQVSLYRLECSFDRTEVSASRLIERVMDQLTVRDLVLEEPAIEDVVQRIYEDKDSLSDVVG
jgi:ABC-2 type transport system ATP-binding protein